MKQPILKAILLFLCLPQPPSIPYSWPVEFITFSMQLNRRLVEGITSGLESEWEARNQLLHPSCLLLIWVPSLIHIRFLVLAMCTLYTIHPLVVFTWIINGQLVISGQENISVHMQMKLKSGWYISQGNLMPSEFGAGEGGRNFHCPSNWRSELGIFCIGHVINHVWIERRKRRRKKQIEWQVHV